MATIPKHSGYTVQSGVGNGPNGNRIDVWIEWKLILQETVGTNNRPTSWVDLYFYAALKPGQSSATHGNSGAISEIEGYDTEYPEDPWSIFAGGYNLPYDFRSTNTYNDFTLSAGETHTYPALDPYESEETFPWPLLHDPDGVYRGKIRASFTTPSEYITGGYVAEFRPALPDIPMGIHAKSGGVWQQGLVYAKSGGVWQQGLVYAKSGGVWQQGV